MATAAARSLRRVQPDLRPGHAVRTQDPGPYRVDPDVAAAAGALGLRRDGHSRFSRGRAAHPSSTDRLARAQRLVRIASRVIMAGSCGGGRFVVPRVHGAAGGAWPWTVRGGCYGCVQQEGIRASRYVLTIPYP